jgi:hypothetical protein
MPAGTEDPGTAWAIECAARFQRPLLVCDAGDANARETFRQWLADNSISVLNVAGPSESVCQGIGGKAYSLLVDVLRDRLTN